MRRADRLVGGHIVVGLNRPLWTSNGIVRKPFVLVTTKAWEFVFPHPDLGDGQHTAEGEDVGQVALSLLRWAQVQARSATVHKVLVAAAQRARQRHQAQAAESI